MAQSKGNKIVSDFIQRINEHSEYNVKYTSISKQVLEIIGKINCLIYVKGRGNPPYRWGITANVIDKLKNQKLPWVAILLFKSHNSGFLLSSSDVDYYIQNMWPLANDGDYKPAAPGSYLANNQPFNSFDVFLNHLHKILASAYSIAELIKESAKEVNRTRVKTEESITHKNLKNYVANNPYCIGLIDVISTSIEHSFPTGDRVDVLFESKNDKWTVVEIEVEGYVQTFVGLLQVVKYISLQKVILELQDLSTIVDGVLVAKSIPNSIKTMANLFKIKIYEITL